MSVSPPGRIAIARGSQPEASAEPEPGQVTVKVALSIEEMMQAVAVRAAVFLGGQDCPYAEEFDGNDCTATHFLGYVGGEPASACRVRYFADFVRLERVAVRPQFRNQAVGGKMIRFVYDFCREKGYARIHGQAEEHLVRFWEKFGFRRLAAPNFGYGGREYVELICDLEPHPHPIAIGKDPMLFVRPEGAWGQPCQIERSDMPTSADPADDSDDPDGWADELRDHLERLG